MLTSIINKWFRDESLPKYVTTARIVLLYKNKMDCEGNVLEDFRPISVTSYLFKIIEKLIQGRINSAIENKTIK